MRRTLRIPATAVFAVLCAGLIALWVRSFWRQDQLNYRWWRFQVIEIVSMDGKLRFSNGAPFGRSSSWFSSYPLRGPRRSPGPKAELTVVVPHWFPALLAGFAAVFTGCRLDLHFRLRTLFIAMTLVAIALGLVVWAWQ